MKLYADVVFFINFFMDFFILWIVRFLSQKKAPLWRLAVGGFFAAALFMAILLLPKLRFLYNFFGALLLITIASYIAFQPRQFGALCKLVLLAHVAAFVIGGTAFALFFLFPIAKGLGAGRMQSPFSWKVLLLSTACIYFLLRFGMGWFLVHIIHREAYCHVRIKEGGKEVEVVALIDTGNSLSEPLTGAPVIVAEFQSIRNFFPPGAQLLFYEKQNPPLEEVVEKLRGTALGKKIRLIPFCSLGKENGMLLGFVPEETEVVFSDGRNNKRTDVVIGIYPKPLCHNKGYTALASIEFCKEES